MIMLWQHRACRSGGSCEEGDDLCFRPGRAGNPGARGVRGRILGSAGFIDQALLGHPRDETRVLRMALRRKADWANRHQNSVRDTHRGRELDEDHKDLQLGLNRQNCELSSSLGRLPGGLSFCGGWRPCSAALCVMQPGHFWQFWMPLLWL